jgi:hypothetical protein
MKNRSRYSLAIATIAFFGFGLMQSPASAQETTGTLNIIQKVVNSSDGTSRPSDFRIHVTKNGQEVAGSPLVGFGQTGQNLTLVAGTYILFVDPVDKYRGEWSGDITPGGTVTLSVGQVLSVTRTNYDLGTTIIRPVVDEPGERVRERARVGQTATIDGGELPNTASPLGDSIILGVGLIFLALIGFGSRKILSKRKIA